MMTLKLKYLILFGPLLCVSPLMAGETMPMQTIPAEVDFSNKLRIWDGFGFNYVEACQTRDYDEWPQDYGGFSLLNEQQKKDIIELVFGPDGLDIDIIKMFLDPWHQKTPDGEFDHETTTENMRFFVKNGSELARKRGKKIDVITTLYGPPLWATKQGFIGGRDFDESKSTSLAEYLIDWALYLRQQDIGVKYLSIHNEGEDFYRWDFKDGTQRLKRFDYNMYWPPEQVNRFMMLLSREIKRRGIENLGVTNGEPSNWTRFHNWGYAEAIAKDEAALQSLDLLTTHGFINMDFSKLSYGIANSLTTNLLRSKKPNLHAWVTSFAWNDMSTNFIKMIYEHIYTAKVNAIIPWAGIQNPSSWLEGDALGTAIIVSDEGKYELTSGYWFYKQLTQAGHRGMAVAQTMLANPVCNMIAFAENGTRHPDAFIVTGNIFIWRLPIGIKIRGSKYRRFRAFRSNRDGSEKYKDVGPFDVKNGMIVYDIPVGSITSFIGEK